MTRSSFLPVCGLLAALAPGAAAADVTCSGSSASLSLGAYTGDNPSPLDSSGIFVVSCSRQGGPKKTDVTVAIGPSLGTGSIANRGLKLVTGSDILGYNLFRSAAMQSVWGDTAGVNTVTQTMDLLNKTSDTLTFTIFGRIPPVQDVRAGQYSDRLTVTVMY